MCTATHERAGSASPGHLSSLLWSSTAADCLAQIGGVGVSVVSPGRVILVDLHAEGYGIVEHRCTGARVPQPHCPVAAAGGELGSVVGRLSSLLVPDGAHVQS